MLRKGFQTNLLIFLQIFGERTVKFDKNYGQTGKELFTTKFLFDERRSNGLLL